MRAERREGMKAGGQEGYRRTPYPKYNVGHIDRMTTVRPSEQRQDCVGLKYLAKNQRRVSPDVFGGVCSRSNDDVRLTG